MAPNKKRSPVLSSKQIRFLRGLGHHLLPAVMVGREGVTDQVLAALEDSIKAHELVKVKIQQNCAQERSEVAELLAKGAVAAVVQILGKTILLFRPNKDLPAEKAIRFP
ncbi:MAG: ribosome assembly RNA-binding protein YhbY [Deltaproteobacteria bacterium]